MEYILKQLPPQKKRLTIGFLDENARDEYHGQLMTGVFEAAQKYNINLIRFGYFSLKITDVPEFQIDRIFEHIQQYKLDGLLFLGWTRAVTANFEKFKKNFGNIPILSIGSMYTDIPNIYFPSDAYIRKILLHLITEHHFRKIAFIEPIWPDDRLDVFIETMNVYGIFDPGCLIQREDLAGLDFGPRARKAVSILLDERKIALDAIVSLYNDETIAIIQELQFRGLNVPHDIAITSYEDGEVGRLSTPSFTTVYYPWKELGYFGCKKMVELLTSGRVPLSTEEPGRIIIRDSCGCLPAPVSRARAGTVVPAGKTLDAIPELELDELNQELCNQINCVDLDMPRMVDVFIKDYQASTHKFFPAELERQLEKLSNYQRFSEIADLVSIFRRVILPYIVGNQEKLIWAENLFHQAQVLLQEKKTATWAHDEIEAKQFSLILQETGRELMSNFNLDDILNTLAQNLPHFRISNCSICLFKNFDDQDKLFEDCRLVLEYVDGVVIQSYPGQSGTAKQNLDKVLSSINRAFSMNAMLLQVGEFYIGFALMEPGPLDERIYQVLNLYISIAILGVMLVDKLNKNYKKFIEQSHREGMAEIVNGVLQKIRNILHSLQISILQLQGLIDTCPIEDLLKINRLVEEKFCDLLNFLIGTTEGRAIPESYFKLETPLKEFQSLLLEHIRVLEENNNIINDIIMAQQHFRFGVR